MATSNIPGLNVGLLVSLWTTSNVLNSLDVSQINTFCHGHRTNVDPLPSTSVKSTPPASPSSGETLAISNQKSKRNKRRKSKKKKSPTSVSHVGDQQPTSMSHARSAIPVTTSHTGQTSTTYESC
jgi:hypothetical protein